MNFIDFSSIELTKLSPQISNIYELWSKIAFEPSKWLVDAPGKLLFSAGGVLPIVFGDKESKIWQAIEKVFVAGQEKFVIAGVNFTKKELLLLGEFYRFARNTNGYKLHCIDERLDNNRAYLPAEVHGECGACAALQKSLSIFLGDDIWQVEDELADEIMAKGCTIKQPIFRDMHHLHTSVVIWLGFGPGQVIAGDAERNQLRQTKALPFRVSLPLFLIKEFILTNNQQGQDTTELLDVLVKWNVQIARNIIGGDHNSLNEFADKTLFVFDQRKITSAEEELVNKIKDLISAVEPREEAKDKLEIC